MVLVQLSGSKYSHILSMTPFNTPSLETSSYNLTPTPLLQCVQSSQQGVYQYGGGQFGGSWAALETDTAKTVWAHAKENIDNDSQNM